MVYDLTRAQWGARPPNRAYVRRNLADKPGTETHHTVGVYGCGSNLACLMRGIQGDHLSRRSANGALWTDIFYNVVIGVNGDIAEGRPAWAQSGAITDLTVCFAGNYESRNLTDAQKRAWHKVRNWTRQNGSGSRVRWHGQRVAVACPGRNVRTWLQAGFPAPGGGGGGGNVAKVAEDFWDQNRFVGLMRWIGGLTGPDGKPQSIVPDAIRNAVLGHRYGDDVEKRTFFNVVGRTYLRVGHLLDRVTVLPSATQVRTIVAEEIAKNKGNCAEISADEIVDKIAERLGN